MSDAHIAEATLAPKKTTRPRSYQSADMNITPMIDVLLFCWSTHGGVAALTVQFGL